MLLKSLALSCLLLGVSWGTLIPTDTLKERANQAQPAIPACTTVATTPPPHTLKCGAEGSLRSPGPSSGILVVKTFKQCRNFCIDQRNCVSFSYKTEGKKCRLYTLGAYQQGFKKGATGVYFYNRSCYKVTCRCRDGYAVCGSYCANLLTDKSNCGACGKACGATETCSEGACYPTSCTNVIDCNGGYTGSATDCGTGGDCFCADVDGQSPGLCVPNGFCSDSIPCASSADCKYDYICSFGSCCAEEGMGVCKKSLSPTCRNENAPGRIFGQPLHGGLTDMGPR